MTGPGCGPAGETEGLASVDFKIQVSVGRGGAHLSWQLLRRLSQMGRLLELRSDRPAWAAWGGSTAKAEKRPECQLRVCLSRSRHNPAITELQSKRQHAMTLADISVTSHEQPQGL